MAVPTTPATRLSLVGLRRRRSGGRRQIPWILVLPAVVLGIGVVIVSTLFGAWYAFTNWNGFGAAKYIGLANFREIFSTPETRDSIFNTLKLALGFFVITNALGLGLALALNRVLKTRHVLRSIFFLPVAVIPLSTTFIWQYILDYNGPLNGALKAIGLPGLVQPWLGNPHTALWSVLAVMVWQYTGFAMVLYLAGLQGIPQELDEAAAVDGATTWVRFRRVTLPLLVPATTVATMLMMIIGLRAFDQVLALTGGGPGYASNTLSTEMYTQTFVNGRYGFGAALALVLSVMILIILVAQFAIIRRRSSVG